MKSPLTTLLSKQTPISIKATRAVSNRQTISYMQKIVLVILVVNATFTLSAQTKKINVQKSIISWIGEKVTGKHSGTINLKEGTLLFKNKKIIGGNFTANMTTLSNTDQTGTGKQKLEGHLKSVDFFDTENYKTSELVIKSISEKQKDLYSITADLTIKGITKPVKFDLAVKKNTAVAKLIIDRTKYNIQYGSGSFFDDLGDRTIYDEFELNVNLTF